MTNKQDELTRDRLIELVWNGFADAYHNLQVEGVFKQMGIAGNPDFPSVKKETP